jgi:hypothetical protein
MLADSLVRLLAGMGMQVVVDLTALEGGATTRYDAAVTTGGVPPGIESDLVIELGELGTAAGAAWVQRGAGRYRVPLDGLEAALELLRAFCPAGGVVRLS